MRRQLADDRLKGYTDRCHENKTIYYSQYRHYRWNRPRGRKHAICVLDSDGNILKEGSISNTREALEEPSGTYPAAVMVMEVGMNSSWISRLLYWTGNLAVWTFASLYLAAMLAAPADGLQVTGMLGLERGSDLSVFYGWSYTAGLVARSACAIASWRFTCLRYPTMILAGAVLGVTVLPVTYSFFHDFRPSFFEHYVGEFLTMISLFLAATAAALSAHRTNAELDAALKGQP